MRNHMFKKDAKRRRARRRGRESSYALELGPATRTQVVAAIQSGNSALVRRTVNRVSVDDVRLDGVGPAVRVVFDRQRKEIVTLLPRRLVAVAG
jgi:Tfp pilus assembly ATPase PilU